jgi:flagellar hook protein FlgE
MVQALHTALSGLTAFARTVQTTAHNLANMHTAGFTRSRSEFQETLDGGVRASDITDQVPAPIFQQTSQGSHFEMQSHVDIGEEMVNLRLAQREFELNASVVSTSDHMLGTVLNIRK